jgi:hypothetical protein
MSIYERQRDSAEAVVEPRVRIPPSPRPLATHVTGKAGEYYQFESGRVKLNQAENTWQNRPEGGIAAAGLKILPMPEFWASVP